MSIPRSLLTIVCVASFALTACAGGSQIGASSTAPSAVGAAPIQTAPLTVQVDRVCAGRESDIRVFVDQAPIGVTNPGDAGLSRMVTVGEHQLSAISQRGTQWGPFSTAVDAAGRVERLGCLPSDGI